MGGVREERRAAPRKKIRLKVRYWNDDLEGSGHTADVSAVGLFVESIKAPNAGDRLHLELTLPEGSFFAEGIVARTVKTPRSAQHLIKSGFAIRFVSFGERLEPAASKAGAGSGALRIDLTDPIRLSTVFANEIKSGGLFIATAEQPTRGATVSVIAAVPKPHDPLQFAATVVQTTSEPTGVAVTFADTTAQERFAAIAQTIEAKGFELLLDLTDAKTARRILAGEIVHGGVFVPTKSPPRRGARVRLTIGLPPPAAPMAATATIMQVSDNPSGVGLQFDDAGSVAAALAGVLGV